MSNFTAYIMCTEITEIDEEVMIVGKNDVMTNGRDRSLIHYICVKPPFRRLNVGTALMKTIMSQREHDDREIMTVASLPASYKGVISGETMFNFFESFDFHHTKKNKIEGRK